VDVENGGKSWFRYTRPYKSLSPFSAGCIYLSTAFEIGRIKRWRGGRDGS